MNILWRVMNLPKMQQAYTANTHTSQHTHTRHKAVQGPGTGKSRLVALVGDSFARRKVDPVSRFFAIVPPSAHRSTVALCHRPSGTGPSPGITSASPTGALATIAPGYLP